MYDSWQVLPSSSASCNTLLFFVKLFSFIASKANIPAMKHARWSILCSKRLPFSSRKFYGTLMKFKLTITFTEIKARVFRTSKPEHNFSWYCYRITIFSATFTFQKPELVHKNASRLHPQIDNKVDPTKYEKPIKRRFWKYCKPNISISEKKKVSNSVQKMSTVSHNVLLFQINVDFFCKIIVQTPGHHIKKIKNSLKITIKKFVTCKICEVTRWGIT